MRQGACTRSTRSHKGNKKASGKRQSTEEVANTEAWDTRVGSACSQAAHQLEPTWREDCCPRMSLHFPGPVKVSTGSAHRDAAQPVSTPRRRQSNKISAPGYQGLFFSLETLTEAGISAWCQNSFYLSFRD